MDDQWVKGTGTTASILHVHPAGPGTRATDVSRSWSIPT